mmetsp:Transcript_55662/g.81835  ORF Transcript_55662/g.81835 Transcript_55662/m.81835 type:complete len:279 (+) Transcript_55662:290-1126(+)
MQHEEKMEKGERKQDESRVQVIPEKSPVRQKKQKCRRRGISWMRMSRTYLLIACPVVMVRTGKEEQREEQGRRLDYGEKPNQLSRTRKHTQSTPHTPTLRIHLLLHVLACHLTSRQVTTRTHSLKPLPNPPPFPPRPPRLRLAPLHPRTRPTWRFLAVCRLPAVNLVLFRAVNLIAAPLHLLTALNRKKHENRSHVWRRKRGKVGEKAHTREPEDKIVKEMLYIFLKSKNGASRLRPMWRWQHYSNYLSKNVTRCPLVTEIVGKGGWKEVRVEVMTGM